MRGFTVGRFQPYHAGHHRLVKRIAEEVDELVVAVGSADASHTRHDPFTGGERVVMLSKVLADLDLQTYVVPIEDVDRHAVWVSHVRSMCPPFDVAYSNNSLVTRLFEEAGVEVRTSPMYDRDELEGTEVRRRMVDGGDWRSLVPDAVVDVIEAVDGPSRVRQVGAPDGAMNGDADDGSGAPATDPSE
jgi:nicotinamide-nucleotide adenylyltransferase